MDVVQTVIKHVYTHYGLFALLDNKPANGNREQRTLASVNDCKTCDWLQMEISGRLSNRRQRDQYLSALLNGSPVIDQQLTEAVKVVVMLAAINAHETYISGVDVSNPVIVWQTFGRMSSLSAEMFFHQHINRVCDGVILGEDKVTVFKPGPDYGIGIVGK